MNPLVNFLQNKGRMPRTLSVFISILIILAIIAGIITIIVFEMIDGLNYLSTKVPYYFADLVTYFQKIVEDNLIPLYQSLTSVVSELDPSQQEEIMNQVKNVGTNIANTGAAILSSFLTWLPNQISKIPTTATVLIFSLLGTFFISKDWYKLGDRFNKLVPERVVSSSGNVFKGLKKAMFGFIKAQFTLISITAVIVLVGLLVLGVDYAITIAIITGLVDLLPYLGTGLIFVPWIIYMFFTKNFFLTIGLSILYIIVIVQRQMMEPKVLSTNIGLDPLATLVALFAGYQLFGFLGLIIGPVTLVIINTLHQTGVFKEVWLYIKGSEKRN